MPEYSYNAEPIYRVIGGITVYTLLLQPWRLESKKNYVRKVSSKVLIVEMRFIVSIKAGLVYETML